MLIVTIMSYVIRIKKHLHNQIEIIENRKPMIEIESNRIARNMNRYTPIIIIESFLCPSEKGLAFSLNSTCLMWTPY